MGDDGMGDRLVGGLSQACHLYSKASRKFHHPRWVNVNFNPSYCHIQLNHDGICDTRYGFNVRELDVRRYKKKHLFNCDGSDNNIHCG